MVGFGWFEGIPLQFLCVLFRMSNTGTKTVEGEVEQLIDSDNYDGYLLRQRGSSLVEEGFSLAIVKFGETPFPNNLRILDYIPFAWVLVDLLPGVEVKDVNEFSARIVVRDPDFEVGDTVSLTLRPAQVIVHSGDLLTPDSDTVFEVFEGDSR